MARETIRFLVLVATVLLAVSAVALIDLRLFVAVGLGVWLVGIDVSAGVRFGEAKQRRQSAPTRAPVRPA